MNSDANYVSEAIRYDDPNIVAMANNLTLRLGIRLPYSASDYVAGTVLARNTVTGMYQAYSNAGSSGLDAAICVLEKTVKTTDFATTTAQSVSNSVLTHAIFAGVVFYDKLTGIDANGITDLGAKKFIGADGVTLLSFV